MSLGRGVAFRSSIGIVGFATALAGCSGESKKDDDSDGGGTGGLGGTAGQGGTAGSPRPSKLGLYMMLRNPDSSVPEVAGRSCPTSTGVEWDIGEPTVQNGLVVGVDSPTPTDFGTTLEDGAEGVSISCTVAPDGTFHIDGGGTDPQITPPSGIINFVMEGAANARGGSNVTSLAVYTPLTFQLSTQAGFPPCGMTNVHEIAPGALWADYDCPALTNPTAPAIACHASGTIVVEYCRTQ